jgi:hypothetical protein
LRRFKQSIMFLLVLVSSKSSALFLPYFMESLWYFYNCFNTFKFIFCHSLFVFSFSISIDPLFSFIEEYWKWKSWCYHKNTNNSTIMCLRTKETTSIEGKVSCVWEKGFTCLSLEQWRRQGWPGWARAQPKNKENY